ncbi:MAG: efflux RND transporter periplasmic adaptor subunit [Bacteroidales bacterium]
MNYNTVMLTLSLAILLFAGGCKEKGGGELPPPNVRVVEVQQADIPVTQEFVGQVYGLYDISIRSRVEGFLEGIHFEEGRRVKKGQLLYTIDPQPFEAKVNGFKGQLAEANTMLVKAESDLRRIEPLAEINAVSQSDLDAAVAQRDAAKGSVEAAEAALKSAQIELGYTRIYSPIDGVIGKTEAYPGDYVGRGLGEAVLNEVSRIDTVRVNFHLPEELYLELARPSLEGGDSIRIQRTEEERGLTMILSDGSEYPYRGLLEFVNRQVDPTTGTILVQATFPNPSSILRPGQFARIRGTIEVQKGGLLIPQRCVQELQGNYNVYVVNDDNTVEFREIEVGSSYATSYYVVTSGLQPGEKVVYEGLQMVRSGSKVNPVVEEVNISQNQN